MPELDRELARFELILELIGHIERRLAGWSGERFAGDPDEIDLTAFRLGHIGEAANKLSAETKARAPAIEWTKIYRMRNVISHEYGLIRAQLIWEVATGKLPPIKAFCDDELRRRLPQ